ncbi:MAG: alpha/beta fold hydrolase [Dehalococcoidia bacterium]
MLLPAAPGSRLLDPDPEATLQEGVRLLVVDRPGYGESTPYPPDTTPSWGGVADDLAVALDALDITALSVAGWSNGGVGSLAFAARHPQQVRSVAVLGAPAPHDEVPWVPDDLWPVLEAMRQEPEAALAQMIDALAPMLADLPAATDGLGAGAEDERILAGPARPRLDAMIEEAFRTGAAGLAADIVATNVATRGFDLAAVECPAHLFYGDDDQVVSAEHGEYYRNHLPAARLRVVSGAGHLLLIEHWGDVLRTVLA